MAPLRVLVIEPHAPETAVLRFSQILPSLRSMFSHVVIIGCQMLFRIQVKIEAIVFLQTVVAFSFNQSQALPKESLIVCHVLRRGSQMLVPNQVKMGAIVFSQTVVAFCLMSSQVRVTDSQMICNLSGIYCDKKYQTPLSMVPMPLAIGPRTSNTVPQIAAAESLIQFQAFTRGCQATRLRVLIVFCTVVTKGCQTLLSIQAIARPHAFLTVSQALLIGVNMLSKTKVFRFVKLVDHCSFTQPQAFPIGTMTHLLNHAAISSPQR
ncbi:MAG: hypothetical protein DDT19_01871 [Syntrophomonadaceae bacterium]|nr:hypothetical protein [Bacillota bacterium]